MESTETSYPARTIKEYTCVDTLTEGAKVKGEVGENEMRETVLAGESWAVSMQIQIIKTSV
jgi:hypothetical protein